MRNGGVKLIEFKIGDILSNKETPTLQAELTDIQNNKYHLINHDNKWEMGWWTLQLLNANWQKLQENYNSLKEYAIKNGFVWKDALEN